MENKWITTPSGWQILLNEEGAVISWKNPDGIVFSLISWKEDNEAEKWAEETLSEISKEKAKEIEMYNNVAFNNFMLGREGSEEEKQLLRSIFNSSASEIKQ